MIGDVRRGPGLDEAVVWEWLLEQGVASYNWSFALREGRRLRELEFERSRWQYPMSIERELGLPCSWWGR